MKNINTILIIGFCIGLFAQPKPFDPDLYQDSTTTYNPKYEGNLAKSQMLKSEKEYLDEYRKKYIALGLKPGYGDVFARKKGRYLYEKADLFYHNFVNLDKANEYKTLGLELSEIDSISSSNFKAKNELHLLKMRKAKNVLRLLKTQIVLVGSIIKVEETDINTYEESNLMVEFQVNDVIKGSYYYETFPTKIKCYFTGWLTEKSFYQERNSKSKHPSSNHFYAYSALNYGFAKSGTKYLLYINKGLPPRRGLKDFEEENVFCNVRGYEVDPDPENTLAVSVTDEIKFAGKEIDRINYEEMKKRDLGK